MASALKRSGFGHDEGGRDRDDELARENPVLAPCTGDSRNCWVVSLFPRGKPLSLLSLKVAWESSRRTRKRE